MTGLLCVLSLGVGFLAGIALDDALDLYRASRKERRMSQIGKPNSRAILGVLLGFAVALQLGVGVLLIDARRDLADSERRNADIAERLTVYTDCTTRWQQSFAAAYQARVESSTAASNALEKVVRAVDAQDSDRFRDSVDAYLLLRDRQIKDQQRNPYPPLPDELCGEKP